MGEEKVNGWVEYKEKVLFHLDVLTKSSEKLEDRLEKVENKIDESLKQLNLVSDLSKRVEESDRQIAELKRKHSILIGIGLTLIPVSAFIGAIIPILFK